MKTLLAAPVFAAADPGDLLGPETHLVEVNGSVRPVTILLPLNCKPEERKKLRAVEIRLAVALADGFNLSP